MGLHMKEKLRGILEGQMNKQYADKLAKAKRRVTYEEWLGLKGETRDERECLYYPGILGHDQESGEVQPGAEEKTIRSLAERCKLHMERGLAQLREQGIWLVLQKGGYIDPEAFSWMVDHFKENPETQLLYGDEDALDGTGEHRCSPCFRPVWSPDTWLSCFYLGSVIALRRELAEKLSPGAWPQNSEGVVFFEKPTQVRRLVHQLLELAGGFEQGCEAIDHFPGMLFHMDYDKAQADVQREYGREDGFDRLEWERRLQEQPLPPISVIIPSKDNPQVLGQCLKALGKCRQPLEILVVDNGSSPENRAEIEKITCGMKYIYEPMPFNFSQMCNRGAREARGEVLLFLNDDITVCGEDWLEAMVRRAMRSYVGAVGLKLYYPDSTKIQHAGIANLPGGPVHKLQFTQDGQEEDYGYGSLDRNVIAVTGACLMVCRDRLLQAGGFREDLQVAYNDVDLCFRLLELGWHNVVLNHFHAYHHESLSRGNDLTREKMQRLCQEKQTLYHRHHQYLDYDPYYPEPLCMELGDMHIYENYLDTRTEVQIASRYQRLADCPEQEPENLACVVGFFQNAGEGTLCLQGHVVVRWDNNACYDRYLLLQKQGEEETYAFLLEERYSREAECGMQEQPNVALCGFLVTLQRGLLPEGGYKIGFQARSRVGRRRLTMWTEAELLLGGNQDT